MMMKRLISILPVLAITTLFAQTPAGYWQQRVEYQIDVRLDDQSHAVQGRAKLKYFNNSPDTLRRVFFHLYWNAVQPGSSMASRARKETNTRLYNALNALQPGETGKQEIFSVLQNGGAVGYRVNETIMEVTLSRPLNPGDFDVYDIAWQAQVPACVIRGGRNSPAGVAYSFTQWYPKMCAYDRSGWHADPYIGHEFYGDFGSFKVDITLPKKYMVAATGVLQNASIIGFGYEADGVKPPPNYGFVNVWKFAADNVHDFAWSADPEYVHEKVQARDGLTLHYIYRPSEATTPVFREMQDMTTRLLPYIETTFGPYLYPQFSFVQGGMRGMEYPMMTLLDISGADWRNPVAVTHEWMHNWYYGMIGNNENDETWLDEGLTSFASTDVLFQHDSALAQKRLRYAYEVVGQRNSLNDEPMSTPANLFANEENLSYCAYSKGEVFMWQLRYIIGDEAFRKGLLRYFADWHFKHPNGANLLRTMERVSGMELDWYYAGWIKTTKNIDYSVESVTADGASATKIVLKNNSSMPMPAEVLIDFRDGTSERHYIPLDVQYGARKFPEGTNVKTHEPWSFARDVYEFNLDKPLSSLKAVTIDPGEWTADTKRDNNRKAF